MSTDVSNPADQVSTPENAFSTLLVSSSPADSLALLPAAVSRAGELAEQMRLGIELRSGSTDPQLNALAAAMEPSAAAHERFVSTWSNVTTLSDSDEEALKNDVDGLDRTYTSMFEAAIELMRHA